MEAHKLATLFVAKKNNHLSEEEEQELERLLKEEANLKEYQTLEKIWEGSALNEAPDTHASWENLKGKLNKENKAKVISLWVRYSVAASLLIVSTLALYFWFGNSTQQYQTAFNEVKQFQLPDGSNITLNQNSQLSYEMQNGQRTVSFSGDAYFEIAKDAAHPFVINAPNSQVKILGTAFRLLDRIEQHTGLLEVNEGKVSFSNQTGASEIVKGGEKALLTEKGIRKTVLTQAFNAGNWLNGSLSFNQATLAEVFVQIESKYNVSIQVADPSLLTCTFSGDFLKEPLNQILDNICLTNNLSFTQENNIITINGKGCNHD